MYFSTSTIAPNNFLDFLLLFALFISSLNSCSFRHSVYSTFSHSTLGLFSIFCLSTFSHFTFSLSTCSHSACNHSTFSLSMFSLSTFIIRCLVFRRSVGESESDLNGRILWRRHFACPSLVSKLFGDEIIAKVKFFYYFSFVKACKL
jgi:hypothetical protein